jgi:hypothetical protein
MRQTGAGEAKRERCRGIDQRYQPAIGLGFAQLMKHRLDILMPGGQPWKIVTGDWIALTQVPKPFSELALLIPSFAPPKIVFRTEHNPRRIARRAIFVYRNSMPEVNEP